MDTIKKNLLTLIVVALVIRSAGNIFQPALSYMANDLRISQVEATTNLSLYYLCLTISYLLFGPLCDRFSKQRLLQLSLIGCFLGALLCGSATFIGQFNMGCVIQAFSAGMALLSSQIWIGDHSDKQTMMGRLAWFSIIVAMTPIFAPMIGGFLADLFSWRYDFYFIMALCFIGLAVTFISPLSEDVAIEERMDEPEQDLRKQGIKKILGSYWCVLTKLPIFSLSGCVLVLFLGQSVNIMISSFLFINEFGLTAFQLGLLSGIIVVGMVIGRFITLFLKKRTSGKMLFICNEVAVIGSTLFLVVYYFLLGTHSVFEIISMLAIQGMGFSGLAIICVNNVLLISGKDKGTALGFFHFMSQSFSWFGVLLAQAGYGWNLLSMQIFQGMIWIVLIGSIVFTLLYLRVYPKYKSQIE